MKRIAIITLSLFISVVAFAKCSLSGVYLLSKSSILNKNGLIILEFYGGSQEVVQYLNKKCPVYLQTGKERVPLTVVETLKGEFQLTEVIFKPTVDLKEGAVYVFHIDNALNYQIPEQFNEETKKWEALTFKINKAVDQENPFVAAAPVELKKTMVSYGCGPAKWVYFQFSGQDESETFVRARVKNITTGKTTEYILPVKDGVVKVGHGMCSGAFRLEDGDKYEVSFALIDQSGNQSSWTNAQGFQKPTVYTDKE